MTHSFPTRRSSDRSLRSKQYLGNFGFADGTTTRTLVIYQKSYGQLDGQISYKITDNFEVFAEAINITKADTSVYLQFPELPFRYESGSRRFYGGMKFSFRSEEHTSELQSLMRTSYAVFCLKKQKNTTQYKKTIINFINNHINMLHNHRKLQIA